MDIGGCKKTMRRELISREINGLPGGGSVYGVIYTIHRDVNLFFT